jgi:hypothetical protein
MLLPPQNFHVGRDDRLARLFLDVREGRRPWKDRFAELTPKRFSSDTLASLEGSQVQHCFQDYREIVFFRSYSEGFHGAKREIESIGSVTAGLNILRSLYRFGAPIPQGFQHDAQYVRGRHFKNQAFDCVEKGRVLISGSHANIYPNDFVRPVKGGMK